MSIKTIPRLIHWHICGECQLNCKFCYAIPITCKLDTQQAKEIIEEIGRTGMVEVIVFTGGEPLLRPDIVSLLDFCKKQGLNTAMDTNGVLLDENLVSKLDLVLDRIGLPLDGPPHIHDLLRGRGNFQKVLRGLRLLANSSMRIKINTVVNRVNLSELQNVGEILKNYRISLWSLYQFYPIGRGYNHKKRFSVPRKGFNECTRAIRRQYSQLPLESVPYSIRKGCYFCIAANGSVYTTPLDGTGKHLRLGNILETSLPELWNSQFVKKDKYRDRYAIQLRLFP